MSEFSMVFYNNLLSIGPVVLLMVVFGEFEVRSETHAHSSMMADHRLESQHTSLPSIFIPLNILCLQTLPQQKALRDMGVHVGGTGWWSSWLWDIFHVPLVRL